MPVARFTSDELINATQAVCLRKGAACTESISICTDTRTLTNHDFFLPLKGENFDGTDFIPQALLNGAPGAFISLGRWEDMKERIPEASWILGVPDPLQAYMHIARYHRRRLNPKVIAVTGSSGKTTTKEMLYAALSPLLPTQCTQKNYNNEVGVSQTLLSLQPETRLLIVEMGMRGRHQILPLSLCAEPDIALITNVGPAHIGLLGSLENIALAKCEIFEGVNPQTGIGIVNGDDDLLFTAAECLWKGRLVPFSLKEAASITPVPEGGVEFLYDGEMIDLALPGNHMVMNALAVLAAGKALGFSTAQMAPGLSAFKPSEGRWQRKPLTGFKNSWVVNDAYNANPSSTRTSLEAFLETPFPGLRRILILGGMKELGSFSEAYHKQLGTWLAEQTEVQLLIILGEEGKWIAQNTWNASFPIIYIESSPEADWGIASLLRQYLEPSHQSEAIDNIILYLKGSRAYHLDEIPRALTSSLVLEPYGNA